MKLLRITTSEDTEARVPEGERTPAVAARLITQLTGEPVENIQRAFWPTPAFPDVVDGWLTKYQPDVVFMIANSYAFTFESVPLRIERKMGRVGRLINARAQQLAEVRAISERRVFKAARKGAFRLIGADSHFTPEQVLAGADAATRRILARENVILTIRGPRRPLAIDGGKRATERAERKRQFVNAGLKEMCAKNHIALHVFETPPFAIDADITFGDRIHTNSAGQLTEGLLEGEFIAKAWLAAHGRESE